MAWLTAPVNQAAGREAERSIHVLPPGTPRLRPGRRRRAPAVPEPVRTREDACGGYRQALRPPGRQGRQDDRLPPSVRAAIGARRDRAAGPSAAEPPLRGAAQAAGTTAVGLIVFVMRHHL
jgi:hypothetical protein